MIRKQNIYRQQTIAPAPASLKSLAKAMEQLAQSIRNVDNIYELMDPVSKQLFEQAIGVTEDAKAFNK